MIKNASHVGILDALGRLAGSKRVGKDAMMGANALQSSRKCRKSSTGVCPTVVTCVQATRREKSWPNVAGIGMEVGVLRKWNGRVPYK